MDKAYLVYFVFAYFAWQGRSFRKTRIRYKKFPEEFSEKIRMCFPENKTPSAELSAEGVIFIYYFSYSKMTVLFFEEALFCIGDGTECFLSHFPVFRTGF